MQVECISEKATVVVEYLHTPSTESRRDLIAPVIPHRQLLNLVIPFHARLPNHDFQRHIALLGALEVDASALSEAHAAVDGDVADVAALKVDSAPLLIGHIRHVLDQLATVAFPASRRPSADIDQVPGGGIAFAHDACFSVVEQRHELGEEALATFTREAEAEPPHATPEDRKEVIHMGIRRHPEVIVRDTDRLR